VGGTRKVNCRAATALRMAAQSLHHSKSVLGDFYRRMRAKLGAPKAITAAAHKLARIIFHLVTTRQEFDASHFAAEHKEGSSSGHWPSHPEECSSSLLLCGCSRVCDFQLPPVSLRKRWAARECRSHEVDREGDGV
jgi:hypothetical protein